jgi:hypothetical protein
MIGIVLVSGGVGAVVSAFMKSWRWGVGIGGALLAVMSIDTMPPSAGAILVWTVYWISYFGVAIGVGLVWGGIKKDWRRGRKAFLIVAGIQAVSLVINYLVHHP